MRFLCRFSHDWFALSYPPTRRMECLRCGAIVEHPSTVEPMLTRPVKDTRYERWRQDGGGRWK